MSPNSGQLSIRVRAFQGIFQLIYPGEPKRSAFEHFHELCKVHIAPEHSLLRRSRQIRMKFVGHSPIMRFAPSITKDPAVSVLKCDSVLDMSSALS